MLHIGDIQKFTYIENKLSFVGICLDILNEDNKAILGILNMDFHICTFNLSNLQYETIELDKSISNCLSNILQKYSDKKDLLHEKYSLESKKGKLFNRTFNKSKIDIRLNEIFNQIEYLEKEIKDFGKQVGSLYSHLYTDSTKVLLNQKNLYIGDIKKFTYKSFSSISFIGICIYKNVYNCERCDYLCDNCPYKSGIEGHDLNSVRSYIVLSLNKDENGLSLEEMDLEVGQYFIEPISINKNAINSFRKVKQLYNKLNNLQKDFNILKSSHMDFGINQKRYQQLYNKLTKQISLNDKKLNKEKLILFQNLNKFE